MNHRSATLLLLTLATGCSGPTSPHGDEGTRLVFEVSEVTQPDVSLSPDGKWITFTLLGHLYQLGIDGGAAAQLTFGPYYDADPIYSPDGSRIAFVSDRGGGEGNVFILDLATLAVEPVTTSGHATRPVWTADGEGIVYLEQRRSAASGTWELAGYLPMPTAVYRVHPLGTEPLRLKAEALTTSVVTTTDGRLAWSVVDRSPDGDEWKTRIELVNAHDSSTSTMLELDGFVDHLASGGEPLRLYARWFKRLFVVGAEPNPHGALARLDDGAPRELLKTVGAYDSPRFAVAPDSSFLIVGHEGGLLRIDLEHGDQDEIPFTARVHRAIRRSPQRGQAGSDAVGRWIAPPILAEPTTAPGEQRVVFEAAGYLYEHSSAPDSATALIFPDDARRTFPALSPDGQMLAYVHGDGQGSEVRVYRFDGEAETTVSAGASYGWPPAWSDDSRRLLVAEYRGGPPSIVEIHLETGTTRRVVANAGWLRRPHFGRAGTAVFFTAKQDDRWTILGTQLESQEEPVAVLGSELEVPEGEITSDGRFLVFRDGPGLSVLSLEEQGNPGPISLTSDFVRSFTLGANGSYVVYSSGRQLWRQPLPAGEPIPIDVHPLLERHAPRPVLLRNVRPLDFGSGGFVEPTSIYLNGGTIRWIGDESERSLADDVLVVEAGGRYPIPGLFDFHAHGGWAEPDAQRAFVAFGVTSVRDPGSRLEEALRLSAREATTGGPIPHYFASGLALQGQGSGGGAVVTDARAVDLYVQARKQDEASFIKIYPSLDWEKQDQVARRASQLALPVAGHGLTHEEIIRGVILGHSVIEHSLASGRPYADVIALLSLAGVHWDPTLTLHMGSVALLRAEPDRLRHPRLVSLSSSWCRDAALAPDYAGVEADERIAHRIRELSAAVVEAFSAGVEIRVGTDEHGASWLCLPGMTLHWELELLARAGLPPLEILRAATAGAAAALGIEDRRGSLQPGMAADVVLLDADPLRDIRNAQSIWRVFKDGVPFDPDAMP